MQFQQPGPPLVSSLSIVVQTHLSSYFIIVFLLNYSLLYRKHTNCLDSCSAPKVGQWNMAVGSHSAYETECKGRNPCRADPLPDSGDLLLSFLIKGVESTQWSALLLSHQVSPREIIHLFIHLCKKWQVLRGELKSLETVSGMVAVGGQGVGVSVYWYGGLVF